MLSEHDKNQTAKPEILSAGNGKSMTEPTLIIGLGGMGLKALDLIKDRYIENEQERPTVRFLALDTD